MRLDDRSLQTLKASIGSITESLPRTLCWTAAWDMLRDAELGSGDYLTLVLSGLRAEASGDIGVLQTLLAQVNSAVLLYGDPTKIAERQEALLQECLTLLGEAGPGSDQQLVFALHTIRNSTSEADIARLRSWLDGSAAPAGLDVDSEVRWAIVTRLSLLGAGTPQEIAAEAARDATDTAANRALTAAAAAPTVEAKAKAWADVVEGHTLSNYENAATVMGFVSLEQRDVLAPYIEKYFAALPGLMASKSPDTSRRLAISLYPSWDPSQDVIDATDAFVTGGGATGILARILAEGRDGVERILRVRAAD